MSKETLEKRIENIAKDLCTYGNKMCTCIERDGHCSIPMMTAKTLAELNYRKMPCNIGDPCYPRPSRRGGEIIERKVSRIIFSERNIIIGYYENNGQLRPPLRTRILDKDIFLSREECENDSI